MNAVRPNGSGNAIREVFRIIHHGFGAARLEFLTMGGAECIQMHLSPERERLISVDEIRSWLRRLGAQNGRVVVSPRNLVIWIPLDPDDFTHERISPWDDARSQEAVASAQAPVDVQALAEKFLRGTIGDNAFVNAAESLTEQRRVRLYNIISQQRIDQQRVRGQEPGEYQLAAIAMLRSMIQDQTKLRDCEGYDEGCEGYASNEGG